MYNADAYSGNSEANCRIYPTDITFKVHNPYKIEHRATSMVIIDNRTPIKAYASFMDNTVQEFNINMVGKSHHFLEKAHLINIKPDP